MPVVPRLRRACTADSPGIAALDAAITGSTRSRDYFARFCDPAGAGSAASDHALLAEDGQVLLGYLLYTRVMDQAEVIDVMVAPSWRGHGVGRQLLREAFAAMGQAGVRRCLLEVRASNTVAIALYRAEGFVTDGCREGYYPAAEGGREDALLMSREL